jgi:hypothetical protein
VLTEPSAIPPTGFETAAVLGIVPVHGLWSKCLCTTTGVAADPYAEDDKHGEPLQAVYQLHQAYGQFPFKVGVRTGQVGSPAEGRTAGLWTLWPEITYAPGCLSGRALSFPAVAECE